MASGVTPSCLALASESPCAHWQLGSVMECPRRMYITASAAYARLGSAVDGGRMRRATLGECAKASSSSS